MRCLSGIETEAITYKASSWSHLTLDREQLQRLGQACPITRRFPSPSVELLFKLMEGVIADLILRAHVEDDLAGPRQRTFVKLIVIDSTAFRIAWLDLSYGQMRGKLLTYRRASLTVAVKCG